MDMQNEQVPATEVDTGTNEAAPQYTEVEQRAMEMGWRPKDEFSGEDVDFIDAKEFVARKPLYDKIGQQSKQMKSMTQAIEALKVHYGKVQETEFNRALAALKAERENAIADGDARAFTRVDDQIKDVEKQVNQLRVEQAIPIVKEEPTVHPEFANWQNRNGWYSSVKYMREFADELGAQLAGRMTPGEVLKEVEKAVRKEFPQKFVNANKADAPVVGTSKGTGATKGASLDLTEQESRIMNTLVRSGAMTKEQYIADLKKVKGIK